jgi:hypothetical protein
MTKKNQFFKPIKLSAEGREIDIKKEFGEEFELLEVNEEKIYGTDEVKGYVYRVGMVGEYEKFDVKIEGARQIPEADKYKMRVKFEGLTAKTYKYENNFYLSVTADKITPIKQ